MIACRQCGCTDSDPCFKNLVDGKTLRKLQLEAMTDEQLEELDLVPCYWVEDDLCSGCVVDPPAPLLYDAHNRPLRGAP